MNLEEAANPNPNSEVQTRTKAQVQNPISHHATWIENTPNTQTPQTIEPVDFVMKDMPDSLTPIAGGRILTEFNLDRGIKNRLGLVASIKKQIGKENSVRNLKLEARTRKENLSRWKATSIELTGNTKRKTKGNLQSL